MNCAQTLDLSESHEKPLAEILQKDSVSQAIRLLGGGGGSLQPSAHNDPAMRVIAMTLMASYRSRHPLAVKPISVGQPQALA